MGPLLFRCGLEQEYAGLTGVGCQRRGCSVVTDPVDDVATLYYDGKTGS
jgi:hypothetical protein